ncbi:MAG: tRNA (adenosine(37)-N6)-dimethylallyltransferase MiaA [Aggregatilineales bacterium]
MAGETRHQITTPLVAIVGSTGVGKTALAIQLAQVINGEIVSADSRQVYRKLDIGTAKPTTAERAQVVHHLIDIVEPDYVLTLPEYQERAYTAIADVSQRGRLPLLVGGTGQYITATLEGWRAPEVPPDEKLRAALRAEAKQSGGDALYVRLLALDPGVEGLIDPHNVRRVIRALEVCLATGQPFSAQRMKTPPPYRVLEIGLQLERETLGIRLDARIDHMMAHGLLDEVRGLLEAGYDRHLPSLSSLGYGQLIASLSGETTLEAAIEEFKRATRTFARRQMTWFTRHDAPIWFDVSVTPFDAIRSLVEVWLKDESQNQSHVLPALS